MKHELKILPDYFETSDGSLINPEQLRNVTVCKQIPPHIVRYSFDDCCIDVFFESMDDAQKEMGSFQQFIKSNQDRNSLKSVAL